MVSFEEIAVFLLATTRINRRGAQIYPTYYESRILPIRETWGRYFPHLYYVLGTNKLDYDFLTRRCTLDSPSPDSGSSLDTRSLNPQSHRQLKAHDPQTPPRSALDRYDCPVLKHELQLHRSDTQHRHPTAPLAQFDNSSMNSNGQDVVFNWTALWVANCTGEYFGIGPTCRCQEAMRYFSYAPQLQQVQWFVFIDDDIYFRPHSIVSFLHSVTASVQSGGLSYIHDMHNSGSSSSRTGLPIALVPSRMYPGFKFSKSKLKTKAAKLDRFTEIRHKCKGSRAYNFSVAQPALINRAAMERMRVSVDANGLTGLQGIWGGSHDSLLGLLLWMYAIPSYSFFWSYYGAEILVHGNAAELLKAKRRAQSNRYIIFHKVNNFKIYKWNKTSTDFYYVKMQASQYDIARISGDDILYEGRHSRIEAPPLRSNLSPQLIDNMQNKQKKLATSPVASKRVNRIRTLQEQQIIQAQLAAGRAAMKQLARLKPSGVNLTVFAPLAAKLDTQYHHFNLSHCQLIQ